MMSRGEPIVLMQKTILVEMKRCTQCGEYRELQEYDQDKRRPSGLTSRCKVCRRSYINKRNRERRYSAEKN